MKAVLIISQHSFVVVCFSHKLMHVFAHILRTAVKDISNNELRDDTTDALIKVADELGKRASIVVDGIIQELPIALLPRL